MRVFTTIVLLLALVLAATVTPAPAQEAAALRQEMEQMRQQFERMKEQYQQTMEKMSERIRALESRPVPPPAPPPPVTVQAQPTPALGAQPSAMDLLRPREPFSLYSRAGAGQLLFDIGVTGDFIGNLVPHKAERTKGGTFSGRENRFFPREIELNLFGQVDPYARAEVRIEASEDKRGAETKVSLAEAALTLLILPYGTQLKMGQMRSRFGLLNIVHDHDLPQPDRPDVYRMFLGEDGLVEKGAELTWIPPLPFYLEVLAGVFNGDNDTSFGRGNLAAPLATARLRTFFELTDTSALQFGISGAHGEKADRLETNLAGFDLKYKYRPDGWLHPLLTLAGEGILSLRGVRTGDDVDRLIERRTRDRFGWYTYAELQPFLRWAGGVRYDATQYPVNPGRQWAVEPYLSFMPSEFLRFRLAYKHTDRTHREGFTDNRGDARTVDELFLQGTFILGAHPAHPF